MPPRRIRLTPAEFDRIVRRAIHRIPAQIQQHLENIIITVKPRPSKKLLAEMGMPADEPLLGIFLGVPLAERSVSDPPLYPDAIHIFQEPLEAMCTSLEELEEEIEITVVHEVAHYLGFSEEDLVRLGYG
jgi:predicted Zn-dependent protease with MMP-like domain